jgi:hypothetical protein
VTLTDLAVGRALATQNVAPRRPAWAPDALDLTA